MTSGPGRMMPKPVPAHMHAVMLRGHGGYEQLEYRTDVPLPKPGPEEVLVRVRAAAVNNTDINMRVGWYSKSVTDGTAVADAGKPPAAAGSDSGWTGNAMAFPLIQGADACGVIAATGTAVASSRIGERVLVDPVIRGDGGPWYLGSDRPGAFADYVCVPSVNAHLIDSVLDDAALASFPCSYTAAENMLERAHVGRDTVLVTGASGGVGSAAVQLARRRGARVVALTGATKAEGIAHLGAFKVLDRDADLVRALGPDSVDVVIDVVGGEQFGSLLTVLRPGGRYAVAGAIAGPLVTLDLRTVYLKDLSLFGCTIPHPDVFTHLVGYIERGEIAPLVARIYPLREIADAQREFLTKKHLGKIVLVTYAD